MALCCSVPRSWLGILKMIRRERILAWRHKLITFYNIQLVYFATLAVIGTFVLWLSPNHNSVHNLSFIDALFNAVSSVSVTGLASVDMHRFSILDEMTLLILMTLGGQVFTSLIPLITRWYSLGVQQKTGDEIFQSICEKSVPSIVGSVDTELSLWSKATESIAADQKAYKCEESLNAYAVTDLDLGTPEHDDVGSEKPNITLKSFNEWLGEHGNNEEEWKRIFQEFGDRDKELPEFIESIKLKRQAMAALARIVSMYLVGIQIAGFVISELYFQFSHDATRFLRQNKISHVFFSLFVSVSAFSNAGYALTDTNLVPFQRSTILLVCLCMLILLGNTFFAPCLRLTVSLLHGCARGRQKQVYSYLLQNPRKCFTHLFSHNQTVRLVGIAVIINGALMICIYGLDWNSIAFHGLDTRCKIVDGLFQTIATRNAGMNTIDLSVLSPPTLFVMAVMMYIAVYPVSITRLQSEEFLNDQISKSFEEKSIFSLAKKLLARDSVYLFIATFLICLTERNRMSDDPLNFSVFNIVFEIVSGYGNVGLSMGYNCKLRLSTGACENVHHSLSGKWTAMGKLVLIIVMMLGRNRGMPNNDDPAIRLPSYHALLSMIYSSQNLRRPFINTPADSLIKKETQEPTSGQNSVALDKQLSSHSNPEQFDQTSLNIEQSETATRLERLQTIQSVDQQADDEGEPPS
eukprot:c23584_g2_i1 orf=361-2433(-)